MIVRAVQTLSKKGSPELALKLFVSDLDEAREGATTEHHANVMVPAAKAAYFEVIDAQLALAALKAPDRIE